MADFLEYTKLVYFTAAELMASEFPKGSSVSRINLDSIKKLDKARALLKEPIILNCSYRSPEWDIAKGRSGTSSHCRGKAFDIKAVDHHYRLRLIYACLQAGFFRIGVYPTFVHVDDDETKIPVMWIGENQQ